MNDLLQTDDIVLKVVNTQWLYKVTATKVRETPKQVIVSVEGSLSRFWKHNGYEVGFSKIERMGCEPNRLIGL